jgi:hypothetical protein
MMWQTPVLSLTAQAFLFTIALGRESTIWARIVSAALALLAALASMQLMAKHRHHEVEDSTDLEGFEKANATKGYIAIHGKRNRNSIKGVSGLFIRYSSYKIWMLTLLAFAIAAGLVLARPDMFAGDKGRQAMPNKVLQVDCPHASRSGNR